MTTKYKIGQRLWPVVNMQNPTVNPPFDCQHITITEDEILYGFTKDYGFPEYDVFASPEEASTEAKLRKAYPVSQH